MKSTWLAVTFFFKLIQIVYQCVIIFFSQNATAPVVVPATANWCQTACQSLGGVSADNPCKCVNQVGAAAVKSFPPRAPSVVGAAAAAYPTNYAVPQANYIAQQQQQYPQQQVVGGVASQAYQYPQQLVPNSYNKLDTNPNVRTSVSSQEGVCERSCFPHTMLTQTPCLCSNQTGVTVKKGKGSKTIFS